MRERIPPPRSISPQAQAALSAIVPMPLSFPDIDDTVGWRKHVADMNAGMAPMWDAMPHGAFLGAPEDEEVSEEIFRFVQRHWPASSGRTTGE